MCLQAACLYAASLVTSCIRAGFAPVADTLRFGEFRHDSVQDGEPEEDLSEERRVVGHEHESRMLQLESTQLSGRA